MVYDASRGVTILFGGGAGASDLSEETTWAWDGSRWAQVAAGVGGGPSPRFLHAMAYDGSRGGAVLFGGRGGRVEYLGDTWTWQPTGPGLRLAARLQPAFGARPFDCLPAAICPIEGVSLRARAGGLGDASTRVRLFDREAGVDLERVWPAGALDAFAGAGSGTFSLVVEDHRGDGEQGALRRWCLHVNDGEQRCAAPERGIPLNVPLRSFIEVDVERVDSLEVEVHLEHPDTSELTIDLESDAAPGVEMQLWTGLGWKTVADNNAGPHAPAELTWPAADEADPLAGLDIGRLVFGRTPRDKAINLRLKPKNPGGKHKNLGALAADYLEVRVKYTHPPEPNP